jgi:hypothetical protein
MRESREAFGPGEIGRDGLLHEHRHAAFQPGEGHLHMREGGGGDHDGIDRIRRGVKAQARVDDEHVVSEGLEMSSVVPAHAAAAVERDPHGDYSSA